MRRDLAGVVVEVGAVASDDRLGGGGAAGVGSDLVLFVVGDDGAAVDGGEEDAVVGRESFIGEGSFEVDEDAVSAGRPKHLPSRSELVALEPSESAMDARNAPPFDAAFRGGEGGGLCSENVPGTWADTD